MAVSTPSIMQGACHFIQNPPHMLQSQYLASIGGGLHLAVKFWQCLLTCHDFSAIIKRISANYYEIYADVFSENLGIYFGKEIIL